MANIASIRVRVSCAPGPIDLGLFQQLEVVHRLPFREMFVLYRTRVLTFLFAPTLVNNPEELWLFVTHPGTTNPIARSRTMDRVQSL